MCARRSPGSIAAWRAACDTGDRTIYLAEVLDAATLRDQRPLNLQRLLQIAPPEKRAVLREQMTADAASDAEAITRWRVTSVMRETLEWPLQALLLFER